MPTILEVLQLAQRHHIAGHLASAEPLYRQVLEVDPSNCEALHLLGVLEYRRGRCDEAERLIGQAIALHPTAPHYHSNFGLVLKHQGKLDQAAESCRRAIQLNPQFADALCNLGIIVKAQGHIAEAMECYRNALRINPQHINARNNLGYALQEQGHLDEAADCYQEALRIDPGFADALCNLGTVYQEQGKYGDALDCFYRVLAINPQYANAYNNIGSVHKERGELPEAIANYEQALRLNPENGPVLVNLGVALSAQKRNAEAVACFRAALKIDPGCADAHNNLGAILLEEGHLTDAMARFREAIRCEATSADAYSNLGLAHRFKGELTEAAACFEEALGHDPGHLSAHANRALLRLLRGDFAGGWPEYEYRWGTFGLKPRHTDKPRWDGAPLAGNTILLYAEQGLGDTIQFVRYAPLVKQRGGAVIVECQAALKPLLAGMAGIDQVVARGEALPPFEVQIPLLSLPGIFATTLGTIPGGLPYLKAETARSAYWAKELSSLNGLKIGIAWQGSPTFRDDKLRSVPLTSFEPLARVENVTLVSLQVGPGAEQLATAPFHVTDQASKFDANSLVDLAAAMVNLHVIVTVDTAVAHLAGALNVPVWVALPFAPDWRWLLERDDSPWYPSVRLFRQTSPGAWSGVFERIALKVRQLAKSNPQTG
jgi:tetratricopeptide (TPR) repeat protein